MDNLDISDSLSSSFPWLPYGASQFTDYQVNGGGDLSYFGQRTAMLEPIIEETSDDDDVSCGHVWTHNENQWSSESEAGSVIRVELIQGKKTKPVNNKPNQTKQNIMIIALDLLTMKFDASFCFNCFIVDEIHSLIHLYNQIEIIFINHTHNVYMEKLYICIHKHIKQSCFVFVGVVNFPFHIINEIETKIESIKK